MKSQKYFEVGININLHDNLRNMNKNNPTNK